MPRRNPVKDKTKKKKGEVKTSPKKVAPKKGKVEEVDTPKPKRKRKKKVAPTVIKLEATEDIKERFETVFSWYRSEKENTATPNGVALEVFELGIKTFESHMVDDEKAEAEAEASVSWDKIPEVVKAEMENKAVDVDYDDEELGYDPDFEEAFQNYCGGR